MTCLGAKSLGKALTNCWPVHCADGPAVTHQGRRASPRARKRQRSRAGEALRVVVQGQDLFEHPSLAHNHSDDVNLGTHSIHTGGQYDSHLLVPIVR